MSLKGPGGGVVMRGPGGGVVMRGPGGGGGNVSECYVLVSSSPGAHEWQGSIVTCFSVSTPRYIHSCS